ncbi:MAG: SDR family oxidoreductase [Taibaiella sp.]|nr:SDR family oxidoreductase [Taibaiella sp.]
MNILLTGGASGLGAAIVAALAADNSNTIYFTYAKSVDAAKETEKLHTNVRAIYCDFSDLESVDALIAKLPEVNPDIIINNANGAINKEHFYKTERSVFLSSFEQNIIPAVFITQECIKVFRKKKFGKIINILTSSLAGKPPVGYSEYAANKAYLLSMSKSWASELIRYNITSNSISPSFMLTGITADTDERIVDQIIQEHPLKKLLTTREVAETVLFFTRSSQHINGVNMLMNAGSEII